MRERFITWVRSNVKQSMALLLAVVLVVVATIVVGLNLFAGPSVDDYLKQAGMADRHELKIGIFDKAPLMALARKPDATRFADYEGFDIEIARALAAYLGFDESEVLLKVTEVQNRAVYLNDGVVDIVVASFSMTEEREEHEVDFAGPYLRTQPEVLVRKDFGRDRLTFRELADMGRKVCTTGSSTSDDLLRANNVKDFDGLAASSDCADGLRKGTYDAFVLDEAVLAGYADAGLRMADLISSQTEEYGIAVANHNEPFRQVVGNFLMDSYERGSQGAWQRAWDRTIGKVLRPRGQPKPNDYQKLRDSRNRINGALGELPPVVPGGRPAGSAARRRRR
jgi:glutamate transport system substrate-binding protein